MPPSRSPDTNSAIPRSARMALESGVRRATSDKSEIASGWRPLPDSPMLSQTAVRFQMVGVDREHGDQVVGRLAGGAHLLVRGGGDDVQFRIARVRPQREYRDLSRLARIARFQI